MIEFNKYTLKKLINWIVLILYLAAIFLFTSQTGIQSNKVSNEIVREVKIHTPIKKVVPKSIYKFKPDWNYILRKIAHFFEYFILFLLFFRTLIMSKMRLKQSLFTALILCAFYASLDEIHQLFVPGRTARFTDVLIDSSGASMACLAVHFRKVIRSKFKFAVRQIF